MWQKIKLILKSVRQYKKYALITPLFMIGEALLECLMPFTMSMLIDSVGNAVNTGIFDLNESFFLNFNKSIPYTNANLNINWQVSILGLILTLVLMAGFSLFFGIMGGKYAAKASVGMGTNLRSDLYKKIQSFSFSNIDKFSASSLVTRLTTDVNQVQMSFQMCIRIVVRAPLMMIFSAVMAFLAGGIMALIFVVLVPIVAAGLLIIGKKAMKIFMRVFKRYDKLNESVQENVSGIRVVKSYVREDFEKQKFNDASNSMTSDFVKAEKILAMNNPLINTTVHASNILVIGLGSFIIWKSNTDADFWTHLTVGQMSSLLTYGIQILMNVMMISMILVMLVMSIECVRRIGEVLEEEPTIVNPENPLMVMDNGDIEFRNVNFKYKETAEKNALSDINIKIKSGQFIGILGSTGSGKTSLVQMIPRLYDVDEGEVLVDGTNVKDYSLTNLRDGVAMVLQKNVLFSGTIIENLQWGDSDASLEEIREVAKMAQADGFVSSFTESQVIAAIISIVTMFAVYLMAGIRLLFDDAGFVVTDVQDVLDEYMPRECVLDLSGLNFMDSSGIAVIVRASRRMKTLGGRFWIENPAKQPQRVIDASGIERLVPVATSR